MQLSIIVPVYNVEQYIRPCMESIFRQSMDDQDFEVILVNDGTQDNSLGVIEDIISRHNNITIIEQRNQGLSVARNTGLSYALGDYILFLDSDDLLIESTLPSLLSYSVHMPDLIVAGFKKMENEEIDNGILSVSEEFIEEYKSGEELFLIDLNPQQCYVWRTIYRKAFLDDNNLRFIPGIYFEDVPFTTECYLKAHKCVKTSLTFYIYRQRNDSIVSTLNIKKIFDFNTVLARLWDMKCNYNLSDKLSSKLMDIIFTTFSISVWYVSHNKALMKKRKEIVSDLKVKVPDLHFTNGFKQTFVSFFYRMAPCSYIRFRELFSSN